ncbi:single-stranded DNA-binding protein [Campylobacter lanienae]|uniref:single-stranded DNA-binding protein n=1 Tax=Campylobacter lanienae TaxID=75658 RepID=UPI000BB41DE8|nr:single-stranded DNA-binding protein [Campylobacter lanienae]
MNQITLCGNLCQNWSNYANDSQVFYSKNSIAINKKIRRGESVETITTFIPLIAFNNTAHVLSEYSYKGDKLLISGELMVSNYDKDGENRTSFCVRIEKFEFLTKKKDSSLEQKMEKAQKEIVYDNPTDTNSQIPF